MADNFDLRKYLTENQLGPFAKARINEAIGPWSRNNNLGDDITNNNAGRDEDPYDPIAAAHAEYTSPMDKMYDTDDWADAQRNAEGLDEGTAYDRTVTNLGMLEDILYQLKRNIATNSNIPTDEKQELLYTFEEMKGLVLKILDDIEQEGVGYNEPVHE